MISATISIAFADVVELKNGQRVEGTMKQADQTSVSVEVGGQTVTFKAEQVRAIFYGSAPTSSPAALSQESEALAALKALQSVTTSSPTYRNYAPRVTDTKIIIDRYLSTQGNGDAIDFRSALKDAMDYHVVASASWNKIITRSSPVVLGKEGGLPPQRICPAILETTRKGSGEYRSRLHSTYK